jgi:hypothetical protein
MSRAWVLQALDGVNTMSSQQRVMYHKMLTHKERNCDGSACKQQVMYGNVDSNV